MENDKNKKIREMLNTGAATVKQSGELQGLAAEPVQATQRAQLVKAPSEQVGLHKTQPQDQLMQSNPNQAEQQNADPAYQTYEQQGGVPQSTPPAPAEQHGQATPNAGNGYTSPYQAEIDELYQQITGRQPFSYNIDQDAMWQSLKDDYQRMGKKAMQDTMGRAAGLTGGYGSSYGQAAGQAAYDEYLTQLSERAPELYDRALNRYRQEGEDMLDRLSMLTQRDKDEYSRYASERAYADERADLEYQRQQREREYADQQADKEYQRQQKERDYIISLIQYGYNPTDDDLERAGMTRDEADKLAAYWQAGNPDMAYRLGLISADEYYRMTGEYPAGYTPPASASGGGSGGGGTGTGGGGGPGNSMWANGTSARGKNARDETNPGRPGGTYGNNQQGTKSFGDLYGRLASAQSGQDALKIVEQYQNVNLNAGQEKAIKEILRSKGVNIP